MSIFDEIKDDEWKAAPTQKSIFDDIGDDEWKPSPEYSAERFGGQLVEGSKDVARQGATGYGIIADKLGGMLEKIPATPLSPIRLAQDYYQKVASPTAEKVASAEPLKQDPKYLESAGFWEDVIRTGPQVLAQIGTGLATGPAGPTLLMGSQIAGSTYESEVAKGVDKDRAAKAGIANAIMQAPLESLGLNSAMKLFKVRTAVVQKLKDMGSALGKEWLTEFLQAYPDAATSIWAENADEGVLGAVSQTIDKAGEIAKQGAKEGLTVLPFAALGASPSLMRTSKTETKTDTQETKSRFTTDLESGKTTVEKLQAIRAKMPPNVQADIDTAIAAYKPKFSFPEQTADEQELIAKDIEVQRAKAKKEAVRPQEEQQRIFDLAEQGQRPIEDIDLDTRKANQAAMEQAEIEYQQQEEATRKQRAIETGTPPTTVAQPVDQAKMNQELSILADMLANTDDKATRQTLVDEMKRRIKPAFQETPAVPLPAPKPGINQEPAPYIVEDVRGTATVAPPATPPSVAEAAPIPETAPVPVQETAPVQENGTAAKTEQPIPQFKTTNEAVAFGEQATPGQVAELERLRSETVAKEAEYKAAKDFSVDRTDNAFAGQLYREALEASRGEHPLQRDKRTPDQMLEDGKAVGVIPKSDDGNYQIYTTKVKTADGSIKQYYAIPTRERKTGQGFGDTLHETIDDAQKMADFNRKLDKQDEERAKREAQESDDEAKAKAYRDDMDGFASDATPMKRGKIVSTLNKPIMFSGKRYTIKEKVRELVKDGKAELDTFQEDVIKPMSRTAFNRATQKEQDAHERRVKEASKKTVYTVGGYDMGKTGYDYAVYLLDGKSKGVDIAQQYDNKLGELSTLKQQARDAGGTEADIRAAEDSGRRSGTPEAPATGGVQAEAESGEKLSKELQAAKDRLTNNTGSSQIATDILNYGIELKNKGVKKYSDFLQKMKAKFADVWDKIKGAMKALWDSMPDIRNERGEIRIGMDDEFDQEAYDFVAEYYGKEEADKQFKITKAKPKAETKSEPEDDVFARNRAINVRSKSRAFTDLKEVVSEIADGADKLLGSVSTRLGNISQELKAKVRKLDFDIGTKSKDDLLKLRPLLDKAKQRMSRRDYADWDFARKNSYREKIKELIEKYDLGNEYKEYREVLDRLYNEAEDVGLDIGYIQEYAPRVLKNKKGFLKEVYKSNDWDIYSRALKQRAAERGITVAQMSEDQKADIISNMVAGGYSGIGGVGPTKARKIKEIPPEWNRFYMDSDAALVAYIHSMRKNIEARKFFGKVPEKISEAKRRLSLAETKLRETTDAKRAAELRDDIKEYKEIIEDYKYQRDYTENIGTYIMELMNAGVIKGGDQATVNEILNARFHERGTQGGWQTYKNIEYIDTMGSISSAMTQIGDFAWAAYENGMFNTAKNFGKALAGKSKITKEDIGMDRIAQEFADASTVSKAVNFVFKWTGLTGMDSLAKKTLIANSLEKYQKRAKKKDAKLRGELSPIFGKETNSIIKDLQDGTINDNIKLLVYSRVLDFQPMALSEMPQKYLTAGNGRVFYMLKTYTIKQWDVYRNEVYNKLKNGDRSEKIQAIQNLAKLAMLLALANGGANEIKDIFLGRKTSLRDQVYDTLWKLAGVSRFITWQVRREGLGTALAKQILPPFKFIDSATRDLFRKEEGVPKTIESIPFAGKWMYWHMKENEDE